VACVGGLLATQLGVWACPTLLGVVLRRDHDVFAHGVQVAAPQSGQRFMSPASCCAHGAPPTTRSCPEMARFISDRRDPEFWLCGIRVRLIWKEYYFQLGGEEWAHGHIP